ncbi:MAG: hypothetical protein EP314_03020 [Bacteroidetes bacterium]|nr:MAG: hypothetical protein EP314_03020 [Bacteroidota bacterium]
MAKGVDKYRLIGDVTVLFQHEGHVDKKVLLDTLPKLEDILDSLGVDKQKKRKIVNIAIETLQNLQLHSYQENGTAYGLPPLFVVSKDGQDISISIGNLVSNSERPVLEDKLRKINSLNEEEIKFLYGVIMKQTVVKFSSKGGAGLGLIDMKKKSGKDLDFDFQEVDGEVSYFNLKITVPC